MEDVKLEFPSLPQCKEDAEVSLLSDGHAQASPGGSSAEKRPQAPTVQACGSTGAPLPLEGVPGPRGGASRSGGCGLFPSFRVPLPLPRRLGLSLVYLI